jgi:carboxy-terminal domain RNA polymerase II polypeptide A small phosphatase
MGGSARSAAPPSALSALVVQTDATGKSTFQQPNGSDSDPADTDSSRAPSPLRKGKRPEDGRARKRGLFGLSLFCCVSNEAVVENDRTEAATTSSSVSTSQGRSTPVRNQPSYQKGNGSPHPSSYGRVQKNERPLTPQQRQVPSLLGPLRPQHAGKLCLVLDLDETLVHSSFQPVKADFIIPVVIEGTQHNVYVIKRPGVDEFLERAAKLFEIVIYTASLSKYADPLLDKLDPKRVISSRLFREHCVFHQGHYVKDLSLLNRDVNRTIIVDNSTMSYIFHPAHAIDCLSFIDDPRDTDLWKIMDFLEFYQDAEDVRPYCSTWRRWVAEHPSSIPKNYQHLEPSLQYISQR